ncbi:MAG: YgaP-like transmembrane domain [Chloroflexota bacterium]
MKRSFFLFIAGPAGQLIRILAGLILIYRARSREGGPAGVGGTMHLVVGLVPLLAGLLDLCVLAPLFGLPFRGPALREALEKS